MWLDSAPGGVCYTGVVKLPRTSAQVKHHRERTRCNDEHGWIDERGGDAQQWAASNNADEGSPRKSRPNLSTCSARRALFRWPVWQVPCG